MANTSGVLHVGINETPPGQNVGTLRAFIWRRGDTPTVVKDRESPALSSVELYQNVPNPFNPITTIRFYLPEPTRATLDVFDVNGYLVVTLFDRTHPAGVNSAVWKGNDRRGVRAASGVYFYRLRVGQDTRTRKMILLR